MVQKPSPRPRGRPRTFDPTEALDKAVAVFWASGYEGADTETLARAMGLTKPSVYAAFGPKEALFFCAVERYAQTVGAAPVCALLDAVKVDDGVRAFFDTIARNASGKASPSGCLLACVAVPLAARMPKLAALLDRGFAATERTIADAFRAAMQKGEVRTDFDSEARARLMVDLMLGMGLRGRAGASPEALQEMAARNTAFVLA